MAECEWAILCDYAFLDIHRKVCLIGIFDRLATPKVPLMHRQTALALHIIGDPREHIAIRIELVRPSGGVLAQLSAKANLGDTGSGDLQFNFTNLMLPDFGLYAFNIYLNDVLEKTAGFSLTEAPKT